MADDTPVWAAPVWAKPKEGPIAELGRREGDILSGSLIKDAGQQITKPFQEDNTAGPPWLQRIGDIGGRVGSIATDVLGSAFSPVQAELETASNRATPVIAKKLEGVIDDPRFKAANITPEKQETLNKNMGEIGTAALTAPAAIGKAGDAANIAKIVKPTETIVKDAEEVKPVATPIPAAKPLDRKAIEAKMAEIEGQFDKAGKTPTPEAQAQMNELAEQWLHPQSSTPAIKAERATLAQTPAPVAKPSLASSLQNIVSPTSAGAGAKSMETNIRQEQGLANRNTAIAEANLDKSSKLASTMTPEQNVDYYNYMEGRSKGATLQDPALKAFADDTRKVFQDTRKEIETLPDADKMGFYEDYFPHMWADPAKAREFVGNFVGKQGSSGALKKREIPTIEEGLKAGLQLKDPNPVRAASKYVTSMNNYIASKKIIEEAKRVGDAKMFMPGKQPEGWVPLTGRFSETPARHIIGTGPTGEDTQFVPGKKLFAPPDVARIHNNYYSQGFEGTGLAHPYEALRKATSANTAAELALSAYHATTITAQSVINDMSRVMKNTLAGDMKGAGSALKSMTAGQLPFVKGSVYKTGSKLIDQYKGLADHGLDMESIADHFAKGGGKIGQDKLYRGNEMGGFFKAYQRGELGDIAEGLKNTAKSGPLGPAKAGLDILGRATEDVSQPLFEHYVPRIKTGAFANLMSDWLRQNPGATEKQIAEARKHYVDVVDDRFGEMNMDNIFWPKLQKQLASLFLRSQGWDIGLVRQAGGGVLDTGRIMKDVISGKGFDKKLLDRPSFLASSIVTLGLTSAAYQYMKTGKAPDEMLDYMAPKTGGTTAKGAPERVQLPGHGRELVQMATPTPGEGPLSGITREAYNKVASFPKNVYEAYENTNYRNDPIGNVTGDMGWLGSLPARAGHVAEGFVPFSLGSSGDAKPGSNLNAMERHAFGMHQAGMAFTDPDRLKQVVDAEKARQWREKMLHDMTPDERDADKKAKKAASAAKRKAKREAEDDDENSSN